MRLACEIFMMRPVRQSAASGRLFEEGDAARISSLRFFAGAILTSRRGTTSTGDCDALPQGMPGSMHADPGMIGGQPLLLRIGLNRHSLHIDALQGASVLRLQILSQRSHAVAR